MKNRQKPLSSVYRALPVVGIFSLSCLPTYGSDSPFFPYIGKVMTVAGLQDPSVLGITLPHEHILLGHTANNSGFILADRNLAAQEISLFAKCPGPISWVVGRSIAEMSSRGLRWEPGSPVTVPPPWLVSLGDYPRNLKSTADSAGINLIMGTGYYKSFWSLDLVASKSIDELATVMLNDILVGVDGSGIKAGVIGEIGISAGFTGDPSDTETKVVKAACVAQKQCGCALSFHIEPGDHPNSWPPVQAILDQYAVDHSKVIIGHVQSNSPTESIAYYRGLLDNRFNLEFDLFTPHFAPSYAREDGSALMQLARLGYKGQLLASQDICNTAQYKQNGGDGYDSVLRRFTEGFREWTWTSGSRMVSDSGKTWFADVNGDGRPDLIHQSGPGNADAGWIYVGLNTGSGFAAWSWNSGRRVIAANGLTWIGDVNGDGKADIISQGGPGQPDAGKLYIALSNGTGFTFWSNSSPTRVLSDNGKTWVGDVNGDGKVDIVTQSGAGQPDAGKVYVGLSNGQSFGFWSWSSAGRMIADGANSWLVDINKDGKADLVSQGAAGQADAGKVYIGLSNGTGFGQWTWSSPGRMLSDNGKSWICDVNGDGYMDLVTQTGTGFADSGWVYVGLGNGSSFQSWTTNSGRRAIADNGVTYVGDVDGDGKADLVSQGGAGQVDAGVVYTGYSLTDHFQVWTNQSSGRLIADNAKSWLVDVNHDGKLDLVSQGASGQPDAGVIYVDIAAQDSEKDIRNGYLQVILVCNPQRIFTFVGPTGIYANQ